MWCGATVSSSVAAEIGEDVLQAQLATGEFGPALESALKIEDADRRNGVLQQIIHAQICAGSGDIPAAAHTAGYLVRSSERARVRGATLRRQQLAGGGTGADFEALIDLITSTIDPESWDEVGGPGSVREYETGVRVDPNGLLRQVTREEKSGALARLALQARTADLNADMAKQAPLRLVSLRRLEQAVAARLQAGENVPETMQRLAGLTAIKYVFVYPDSQEIVIAGPAEGWRYGEDGRCVGQTSGAPLMSLDDLVVVLRTFAPQGEAIFGCSINPRAAQLKDVKEFVEASQAAGPLKPGKLPGWAKELQQRLGLQDVVVYGVPADSRVAQVLVEADYRMKLIGVDKLDGGPDIPSYFDLLKGNLPPEGAPLDALRWWLSMKYAAILHSSDRTVFELQGSSVLVQSENQFVTAQGQHVPTGAAEPINRLFAQNFTKHYQELAKRDAVFADLQNIFDLGMVAAIYRHDRLGERIDWDLGAFAPDGLYRPQSVPAPTVVESVVNYRVYGGRQIVVQVAGGVTADTLSVASNRALAKESPELRRVADQAKLPALPPQRWWWDAAESK